MTTLAIVFWAGIFLVFYTYLGYGILLYGMVRIKEWLRPRPRVELPDELPEITLFIAAYNERDIVAEKMENCLALDYPADKLRILWVTDGTDDDTNELLKAYPRAEVLFDPERRGKAAAFNRGMPYVTTACVIFTDANTMLNREAIREIVRCFENPQVGCVAGEKRVRQENEQAAASTEGIYWKYESKLKEWDWRLYSAVGAAGELFALRTELFETMPADTLLDDFILSMRIATGGHRIAYCKEAYALEGASADMKEEGKRKVRIAAGGLQAIHRLGAGLFNPFKYGILSFQYVSHRVLRWSVTPVVLFLLLPLNVALALWGEPRALYVTLLALQVIFYGCGLWGYALSMRKIRNKLLFIPYYFLFMNLNVLRGIGYLRRRRHNRTGAWEKARRA